MPEPVSYYYAVCRDCRPLVTRAFTHPDDRASWAADHMLGTSHIVDYKSGQS
jgi:hypothetical protein